MAIQAAKLTTAGPGYKADTWAIDGRTGGEGMKEAHLAGRQGPTHVNVTDVSTQIHTQFKRASCQQRRLF
jgi:hypothetical protein